MGTLCSTEARMESTDKVDAEEFFGEGLPLNRSGRQRIGSQSFRGEA